MLTQWIRVFHNDNGTLTDVTVASQNDDTIALPLVAAEDEILIGQNFPFNNLTLKVNTANSNASVISTQIWANEWRDNVDHLDETSVSGVALARSGVLMYSPDRRYNWIRVEDTSDSDGPTELSGVSVYNLYWMKIKVSGDLSAGTILDRIGYRFATTQMLQSLDPDMDDYLPSWETGKTDWDEQLMAASDQVISDMQTRGIVLHPGQILRMNEIGWATAYRALINIYTVLGTPLEFRLTEAKERYSELMSAKRLTLDVNMNALEERGEVKNSPVGMMVR